MWQWPSCHQSEARERVTSDREPGCLFVSPLVFLLTINPWGFSHGASSSITLSNPQSLSEGPTFKNHSWAKFLFS
jgi:hypothetical protein